MISADGSWDRRRARTMESRCPGCGSALAPALRKCGSCNYDFSRLSLFDPGQYPWLAVFFSFVVPALLATDNWRRAGVVSASRQWLWISTLGFLALAALGLLLPRTGLGGTLLFAYLLNLPIGFHLYRLQRPFYEGLRSAGARRRPSLHGVILGLGALAAYWVVLWAASELLERLIR